MAPAPQWILFFEDTSAGSMSGRLHALLELSYHELEVAEAGWPQPQPRFF